MKDMRRRPGETLSEKKRTKPKNSTVPYTDF
jgi:hypothetical protein